MSKNNNSKILAVNFHKRSVEQCMKVINNNLNVASAGFFTVTALTYIESVIRLLKAYTKTPGGKDYLDFGHSDSFGALFLHCNNYRSLSRIVSEIENCRFNDPQLSEAINRVRVDYNNLERSPETADAVRLHINAILTRIDRKAWRSKITA